MGKEVTSVSGIPTEGKYIQIRMIGHLWTQPFLKAGEEKPSVMA